MQKTCRGEGSCKYRSLSLKDFPIEKINNDENDVVDDGSSNKNNHLGLTCQEVLI